MNRQQRRAQAKTKPAATEPTRPRAAFTYGSYTAYDLIAATDRPAAVTAIAPEREGLPGWRVDRIRRDGSIGDYRADGTATATCFARFTEEWNREDTVSQAILHDPACTCGYRMMRNVYTLLQYLTLLGSWRLKMSISWNAQDDSVGYVLTRVLGSGTVAPGVDEPPGTVRVTDTRLAEVYVPRTYDGETLPADLTRKVKAAYAGVKVRRMPGDLWTFEGAPDMAAPPGWPAIKAGHA